MAIDLILRMTVLTFLPFSLCGVALGAEGLGAPPKTVDYQRADTNFYARGDVLRSDPNAVILPPTAFAQNGDTYTYTPKIKAPKTLYIDTTSDWVEPITPPDMPASLSIAPDAMQIREPQGDVQVAMPNAPSTFSPVTDGMLLPNGAVVKTGTNATAAILFGGVDSARLMPDSEAAVQQTVTATSRSTEVDLTAGGVFAKVGTQLEVTSLFQVHTPFGNALAQAGDFAAVATNGHTDIWTAQGTVELLQPDGKKYGVATADGTGPLKLIRFPAIMNPAQSMQADAESLTSILNFIPVADQKLATLHAREAKGTLLSANEEAYIHRIKQVTALIKLALVEPPAPPPPPAPAPAAPAVPAVAAAPAPPQPVTVIVHSNGTIKFKNITMGLEEFQAAIKALVAAHPDQGVIVKASTKVNYAKFTAILDACKNAPVKELAVAPPAPQPPPPAPAPAAPPPAPAPVVASPAPAAVPAVPAMPATPAVPAPAPNPYVSVIPGGTPKPPESLTVLVHEDGSVGFKGKRGTLADFQAKLAAVMQATPDREIVIKTSGPKVAYDHVKAVLDVCADAHVAHLTAPPAPPPVPAMPVTAETPPAPAAPAMPVTAEATPAPPAPAAPPTPVPSFDAVLKQGLVPLHLGLDAKGQVDLAGASIDDDALKTRLAAAAQSDPNQPVVLVRQAGVTRAQWQHVVDVVHSAKLKIWVFGQGEFARRYPSLVVPGSPPLPAPVLRPAAAEGGPIAQPAASMPAPHLSASPAPQDSSQASLAGSDVPVEIELTPDGQISFLGESVSESDLKSRLDGVAQGNSTEPVLIVKDEKVTHDQWQKVVDICHAAKLKVRLKTVKSSDSGALTPHSPNATAAAAMPAVPVSNTAPAPDPDASPDGKKIVPVEIDIAAEGRLTFEGAPVDVDQLEARLARFAHANPDQPVLIAKKTDVTDDSLEALLTLCRAVDPNFKLTVKTVPVFLPPAPPMSPAENLPAPAVHMHPSMDALNAPPPAPSP